MASKPGAESNLADNVTRGESVSVTLSAPATSHSVGPDDVEPSLSWHEASVWGGASVPAAVESATKPIATSAITSRTAPVGKAALYRRSPRAIVRSFSQSAFRAP